MGQAQSTMKGKEVACPSSYTISEHAPLDFIAQSTIKEVACPSSYTISEHAPLDFIKDLEKARDRGMDHFAHEHRLKFKEKMKYEGENKKKGVHEIICQACCLEIEGCGFSCSMMGDLCSWRFDLHQICAFLPRELQNYPNHHSDHTLILHYDATHLPVRLRNCSLCYKSSKSNFVYKCNKCSFCLDVKCASKSILVCGYTHQHPLTPKLYPALFECSLCHQKLEKLGVYYECNTCTFLIHEECYFAPTIHHASHAHPLRITYLEADSFRYKSMCCVLCSESIKLEEGILITYSCIKCNFYIHRHCTLKKWEEKPMRIPEGIGELIEFPMPTPRSIENILSYFIKQKCEWKVGAAEDKTEPLLKHAYHDHPLVLNDSNNSTVSERSCHACSLLLSDASFYSCTQLLCNFVLHKWCAKLPLEMQHPAHLGHTLLLNKSFDFFICYGCCQEGNGFVYNCSEGECSSFKLDVRCACFPSFVKHETHQHPLLLTDSTMDRSCTSCGASIEWRLFSFGCDACTFSIDIHCLLLPREIKHWYDREHGFKLTYNPPICEQGYYCDFCEKRLEANNWIYHCFECDWSLDTNCVRKAFNLFQGSRILGESQDTPLHRHALTCVLVPRELHTFCSNCGRNNYKNDGCEFSCTECKIEFCSYCVRESLYHAKFI